MCRLSNKPSDGKERNSMDLTVLSSKSKSKSKHLLTRCLMPGNDENQDPEPSQQQSDETNKFKILKLNYYWYI
ncbi:unnamed protein product [Rotaria sp. Silwood1]|nr:unnamed protein product [Rotaria sp. Silwood1]